MISVRHACVVCVIKRVDCFGGMFVPLTYFKGNFVLFYYTCVLCIMLFSLVIFAVERQICMLLIVILRDNKDSVSVSVVIKYKDQSW